MTAQKVTLVLDECDATLAQVTQGHVAIAPSARLPDPADEAIIGQAPVTVPFSPGSVPQVELVGTDQAGPQPDGWTYTITYYQVPGVPFGFSWSFYLRFADGATRHLSDLAQVPAAVPGQQYVPLPGNVPADGNVPVVTSVSPLTVQWQANAGADKNFTQEFGPASSVTVNHNLAKYPAVTVMDSAGDEVEGDIAFTSANSLTVSFSAPFSGTVTCN